MAQPSASNPPFRRPRVFFLGGEGPRSSQCSSPKGGGGLGGRCMEQRHLGVVGWGKVSTAGLANIEDNADSPLANGEGAAGTLGVSQQQS